MSLRSSTGSLMARVGLVGVGGALLLAISVLASPSPLLAQAAPTRLTFGPGRDGTQAGTVTLTPQGNQTMVVIDVAAGAAGVEQPAHIHTGLCPGVGAVVNPLTNVIAGKSTTTLNITLASVLDGNHSVNIHKGPGADSGIYTACVNLPTAAAAPASAPPAAAPPSSAAPAAAAPSSAAAPRPPVVAQAPAKGPVVSQGPAKGPVAFQAPRAAAALAPRLPGTGNGGLLPQQQSDSASGVLLAAAAASLIAAAGGFWLRRRSTAAGQ